MGTGTKPHTLKPIKTDYNGYNETVTLLKSKFFILRFQSRDQNWGNHFRRPCWKIYKAFRMADVTSSSHTDIVFDDYWLTLDDITKARFRYKALLYGFDPYKLKKSDFSEDLSLLPAVQYPDIVNYLVVQTSWTTMLQMKSYKAMEAYNFFVSGWVNTLQIKKTGGKVESSLRIF